VRRFFVTGTDTGVGKTQAAGALLALLARTGHRPFAFKPYETGIPRGGVPEDAAHLRACAGRWQPLDTVCLHRFVPPLAPGVAAERSPRPRAWRQTLEQFGRFEGPGVVEGAGGLLVPLDGQHQVIDLAQALRLPVVLVARAGLGTLNHVGLSLEALRARRLDVAAVVLSRSSPARDPSEAANPRWLRKLGVKVLGPVAHLEDPRARHAAFERALRPLIS